MNVIRTMATQLVFLKDVERLSPTVIRILGGNPSKVRYPMRLHDWTWQCITDYYPSFLKV
jgi:hypothetical protein